MALAFSRTIWSVMASPRSSMAFESRSPFTSCSVSIAAGDIRSHADPVDVVDARL